MKKILIFFLLLISMLVTTSCGRQKQPSSEEIQNNESRFVIINWSSFSTKPDVFVYVDTHTGVAYVTTINGNSLFPLYDAEGNILVYEEYVNDSN